MSDILIKGMEMPKSCYACMFFAQTDYWNKEDEADILSHCKRTGEKTWESVNGYLPNCPLVPVPPHGRLGDLDELSKKIEHDRYNHTHTDGLAIRHHVAEYGHFLKEISDTPTIIPSTK